MSKKKPHRPSPEGPSDRFLQIRCSDAQWKRWHAEAKRRGYITDADRGTATWAKAVLEHEVGR